MALRLIIGVVFCIWLVLVLLGKGGFVHTLLLLAIGISSVEIVSFYRKNLREF